MRGKKPKGAFLCTSASVHRVHGTSICGMNMCYFPWLVLKGSYHYWTYFSCCPGRGHTSRSPSAGLHASHASLAAFEAVTGLQGFGLPAGRRCRTTSSILVQTGSLLQESRCLQGFAGFQSLSRPFTTTFRPPPEELDKGPRSLSCWALVTFRVWTIFCGRPKAWTFCLVHPLRVRRPSGMALWGTMTPI